MNKAVIFARNGIINELVWHGNQLTSPYNLSELKYIPRIVDAVKIIKDLGFLTFIVTNQINLPLCQLSAINNSIKRKLDIDEVYSAINQNSDDYKPGTGLFEKIIENHKINPSESYVIANSWKDIIPGYKTGFTTIFAGKTYWSPCEYEYIPPNYTCLDACQASLLIEHFEYLKKVWKERG